MFASPVTGRGFIFCGFAVVSSPEIGPTFRVFVFCEIAVITMSIRNLLDLVAFFAEDDKFFLRPLRRTFRLVETREGLAMVLDSARREPLEAFVCHGDKLPKYGATVNGEGMRRVPAFSRYLGKNFSLAPLVL